MALSSILSISPLYLALAALALFLLKFIISSYRAGLSHVPGPFLARFTDAWAGYQGWKYHGKDMSYQRIVAKEYGDVVRVGPRTVFVNDPEAIPPVMGLKARLDKGPGMRAFLQGGVNASGLVTIPDEYTHSRYRRPIAHAYSLSSLKGYEPYVDEMIKKLVDVLNDHVDSQSEINMSDWLHFWSYDVIGKLTFGAPIGFMDKGYDFNSMIQSHQKFLKYADVVGNMPSLDYVFKRNPIFKLIKKKPSDYYIFSNRIVRDRIAKTDIESLSTTKSHPDLVSAFIAAKKSYPEVMTDFRVAMLATTNVAAGTLSTSLVLDRMMQFLAHSPDAQEKLYQEVKALDQHATNMQTDESDSPAALDLALKMPYLEAVVLESYRLHSSAANNLERMSPAGGMELPSGHYLPQGTVISFNAPAISRHVGTYGANPESFDPSRWIQREGEKDDEYRNRKARMDRSMLTFGYGSRSCLGKNVVQLEMFKVWATLLGMFKFEAVKEPRKHQIWVKVKRRDADGVTGKGTPLVPV